MKHLSLLLSGITIGSILFAPVAEARVTSASQLEEARTNLQKELTRVQELRESQSEVDKEVRTIEQELDYLQNEITTSEKEIESTNFQIGQVQEELGSTRDYIAQLESTIQSQKQLMKEYIHQLYVKPRVSLIRILLSNERLSDVVGSVEQTSAMQNSITETIQLIEAKEQEIVREKQHLFDKEEELLSLRKLQEDQQSLLETTREEKEIVLAETQGEQEKYQELLLESITNSNSLLSRIRTLGGGSEGGAISLEEAYSLATINAARFGNKIRPEFLVGVMTVESGLGRNVGRFFYKDSLSGCAARPGNGTRINFAREEAAFEQIVSRLGLPVTQPVSGCPFPQYVGTGGAMGPAQVMPTTWLAYEPRLRELKGGRDVNPWAMEDAMLAMTMVLLGKVGDQDIAGNAALERQAAMCYLGGCRHGFYADRVMNEAARVSDILGK